MPRVSVVLAVKNPHPEHFQAAVRSILDQTLVDLELIVVEDPSARSAAEMLVPFRDARIRHMLNTRRGKLGAALNVGVEAAAAPLVARIDADDIAEPKRLARQLDFLAEHPEIDVLGSQITVIDERGTTIGARRLPLDHVSIARALTRYNCISHPSVVFRKEVVIRGGGYPEEGLNEDYDLWCRLSRMGVRLANHSERLIRYRFHAAALKFVDVHDVVRSTMEIKRRHFGESLDLGARARLLGEGLLLHLPPPLIIRLFRASQYGGG